MKVVIDAEFVRLLEDAHYWVVEDKILSKFPFAGRGNTQSILQVYIDFVNGPRGLEPARWYYPKKLVPLRVVMDFVTKLNEERKKEWAQLQAYQQVMKEVSASGGGN